MEVASPSLLLLTTFNSCSAFKNWFFLQYRAAIQGHVKILPDARFTPSHVEVIQEPLFILNSTIRVRLNLKC